VKTVWVPRDKSKIRWPLCSAKWEGPCYLTFGDIEALLRDETIAEVPPEVQTVLREDKPTLRSMLTSLKKIVAPDIQATLQGKVESN